MIDIIGMIEQWERDGEPTYDLPKLDETRPRRRYAWPSMLNLSGYKCDLRSAYEIVAATSTEGAKSPHAYLGIPKDGGENHELQRLFSLGNFFERQVVMAVKHSKANFMWNGQLESGKYDLYFPDENEVVEVKFTSSAAPSLDRLAQIGSYMIELNCHDGQFIFINSKTLEIKSFHVLNENECVFIIDENGDTMYAGNQVMLSLSYAQIANAKQVIEELIQQVQVSVPKPPFSSPVNSPCTSGKFALGNWTTQCHGKKADGTRCSKIVSDYPVCTYHTGQVKNFRRRGNVVTFDMGREQFIIDTSVSMQKFQINCPMFSLCWKVSDRTLDVIVGGGEAGFYDDDGNYVRIKI